MVPSMNIASVAPISIGMIRSGMPMVMMSGWIAADALDRDLGGAGMSAAAERAGLRDALRAAE